MPVSFSKFASSVQAETAFTVLAVAKNLIAAGKDVIELEIGDSPFDTPEVAVQAGNKAIQQGHTHYGPSLGIPQFREAAAEYVNREYGLSVTAENIIAGPGAKNFQQLFCEAFLNPRDHVLVFSPHFPTYPANIARRGAVMVTAALSQENAFRPDLEAVKRFLDKTPSPRAIFLNSPHNPTGGIALEDDLRQLADLVRGQNVAVFSDEPYDRMVWNGNHSSLLAQPGMINQAVAAYTFSKSYSMSGWRLGFAVSSVDTTEMLGKLTNTALSCVPPFTQLAGVAALNNARAECDRQMQEFGRKVRLLVNALNRVDGVDCLMPGGSFYAFPCVAKICQRLGITSHGLAMYLLQGADPELGVACLGGECFGDAGIGFLRLSCAQPDERLIAAVEFLADAITHTERVATYLDAHPEYRRVTAT